MTVSSMFCVEFVSNIIWAQSRQIISYILYGGSALEVVVVSVFSVMFSPAVANISCWYNCRAADDKSSSITIVSSFDVESYWGNFDVAVGGNEKLTLFTVGTADRFKHFRKTFSLKSLGKK